MSATTNGEAVALHGITEDQVLAALLADKGSAAKLTSWDVVDFTKKGDNYISVVTNVKATFTLDGKEEKISYVAKISDEHLSGGFSDVVKYITVSEVRFFQDVVPELNHELAAAGQPSLRLPRCFYTQSEGGRILLILEDLRSRGFIMRSRHEGLDVAHTSLVVKELARLHAASLLLQEKGPLHHKFPYLATKWANITQDAKEFYKKFLIANIDIIILTLEKHGGYSGAIKWLQDIKPRADDMEDDLDNPSPFLSLCHGDAWNNNFLFRYNESGQPVEVMMLDLQLTMLSSLATDLNYYFFTSVEGPVRRHNTDTFMDTYYNAMKQVMEAGHMSVPFTPQELKQEYQAKHYYGAITSCWTIPTIIAEEDDTADFKELSDEKMKLFMEKRKHNILNHLMKSPLLKPRLLDGFDELKDCGMITE